MSRIIEGGAAFRLRPAMKMLRDAIDLAGGDADASDMADMAFGLAKGAWEKEHQRPLPYAHWPALRVQAVLGLAQVIASSAPSGRRNPGEAWTGSEKQIAWAKAIRAGAEEKIFDWIDGANNRRTRLTQGASARSPGVRERRDEVARELIALHAGLRIYDAKFWIDARNCPDRAAFIALVEAHGTRANPGDRRVMPYAAAHRWEALAKAKGVSAVARSERGFMRAYERAGTWAKLDPRWKRRREGFIARHMAQASSEQLWKRDKAGKMRPSRRALALIMWAFMPPGRQP